MRRLNDNPLWRELRRSRIAQVSFFITLLYVLLALVGPALAPYSATEMLTLPRQAPSGEYWFGTDEIGRDIFSRMLLSARVALTVGFVSVGIGLIAGGAMGVLAGYFGGWIDSVLMRVVDVLLAFPAILLALAIIAVLGTGLTNTMIAVGIASIPGFARVVRAATLEVKERVFVEAARALGGSAAHVMFRHVGSNIMSPLIVLVTLQFPIALLSSAALGFVGLGAQPPDPEWGAMLVSARDYLRRAPWLVNAPGFAIVLTVLGFNLLGNALRDALDPTQRGV